MTIETKYSIGQEVFILIGGTKKVQFGYVNGICLELHKNKRGELSQQVKYTTNVGTGPFSEEEWFPTKEALLQSL